jgi:hypothetical protein
MPLATLRDFLNGKRAARRAAGSRAGARALEGANLSLDALRLVHACYHFLDQHPFWKLELMALPGGKRECTARCTELVACTANKTANDNSMIHQGIADLEGKRIFDVLELSPNHRTLRFRFCRAFAADGMFYKGDLFAMVDTAQIAALPSPTHIQFYTRAVMAERSNYPLFLLPGINAVSAPWAGSNKRRWLRAAARVGPILEHDYLFIPILDDYRETVIGVKVKITTSELQWSTEMLFPRHSPEPISVVENGKVNTLTAAELAVRRTWRKVASAC